MSNLAKLMAARAAGSATTGLSAVISQLNNNLRTTGAETFAPQNASGYAFGLESLDNSGAAESQLDAALNNLEHALESLTVDGLAKFSASQKSAALLGGALTGDVVGFLNRKPGAAAAGMIPAPQDIGRVAALESYDGKENRATALYTVAYNLQAARQDEFGEAFYPTVIVPPDQQGYTVQINLINLINEIRRQTSGALDNYNRKNIVHVVRNPKLIQSDSTTIYPVVRDDALANFVDAALIAPRTIKNESGVDITTSALATGKKFSLLGISQLAAQLDTANQDETDTIDTDVRLKKVYVKAGADVLSFATSDLPTSLFVAGQQGDTRRMDLRFETRGLFMDKSTTQVNGSALVDLKPIVDGDLQVFLGTVVFGSVILDIGTTEIQPARVEVVKILNAAKESLSLTTGAGAAIANLFANASVIGYDLAARRTNLNKRTLGQMLETREERLHYAVPLLAPVAIKRPQGVGDATDTSDLAALVTIVRAMTSGKAVEKIMAFRDLLKTAAADRSAVGENVRMMGIASYITTPFYEKAEIDVSKIVGSLASKDHAENIQATIINVAREMVSRAYEASGFKAANDLLAGGEAPAPEVVMGTGLNVARWLQLDGEMRTMGEYFGKARIVATQNEAMKNTVFITFAPKGRVEGVPHPLDFGNMAWKPEVAVVLPIHRNGANNKELTVQPSFIHVNNTPVLIEIEVTGFKDAVQTRIPVHTHEVA